jgi:hypothetical protein
MYIYTNKSSKKGTQRKREPKKKGTKEKGNQRKREPEKKGTREKGKDHKETVGFLN